MEPRKQAIIGALRAFVRQRPGLEFANYGDLASYRAESRRIQMDKRHAETLLAAVAGNDGITAGMIVKASESAFSGRLKIREGRTSGALLPPHVGRNWTCGCGLYANPESAHYNASAVHIDDCPMRTKWRASLNYVTGQYFPTEYRKAVAAVCASALWYYVREHELPKHASNKTADGTLYADHASRTVVHAGDWLRAHFRREFGRTIAGRYFQ